MGKAGRTSKKFKKTGQVVVRDPVARLATQAAAAAKKEQAKAAEQASQGDDDAEKKSDHKQKRNKRGARNKKKNAKKIDLKDVTAHLESVAHDERTGGKASDKADDELFYKDTTPGKPVAAPVRSRKERARAKTLHVDAALVGNTHTKKIGKIYVKQKNPEHMEPALFRQSKRKRMDPPQLDEEPAAPQGREVWDAPEPTATIIDLNPWLEPVKDLRDFKKKRPDSMQPELSVVPAIEHAPEGTSYNPSLKAHQDLLRKANDFEEKKQEDKAILEKKLPKVLSGAEKDALMFQELSVGLGLDDNENESSSESEDEKALELAPARNPVSTDNRKTQQKRKRILKDKVRLQKIAERKLAKKREQEFFRLRGVKREVNAVEELHAQRQVERKIAKQTALGRPRKLGRTRYREPTIPVKLTDELKEQGSSLRNLKPESNLFKDRFHSMQKRNMVEVRIPTKLRRRYKLKEYEKRSYKNYDLQRQLDSASAKGKKGPNNVEFLEGLMSKGEGKGANLAPIE